MNELSNSLPLLEEEVPAGRKAERASLIDWGIELRLWVATCVTGLCFFCIRALDLSLSEASRSSLPVVFFATLALYNLDGTLDAPTRSRLPSEGKKRRHLHLAITAVSGAALLFFLAQLSEKALAFAAGGALLCSTYAIPWGSRSKREASSTHALKSLPFLKAPFVGTAVATACVGIPHLSHAAEGSVPPALALALPLSLYCTNNALLFDIPDVREDERTGVPTLPLVLGLKKTKLVSVALSLLGIACSLFLFLWGRQVSTVASLVALGLSLVYFSLRTNARTSRRSVAWWVDGALLLPLSFQTIWSM